jgi:hypothetical protein
MIDPGWRFPAGDIKMSVKFEKSKVGTKIDIDGVPHKVSREVDMPKSADTIDDVLALCDGKLTSARGEKPGLIDAALSGIVAFLRREEVKMIEKLMGGKEAAILQLATELATFPGQTAETALKHAAMIINEGWTEEQENARKSLKIEKIEKGAEVEVDESEGEPVEPETAKA